MVEVLKTRYADNRTSSKKKRKRTQVGGSGSLADLMDLDDGDGGEGVGSSVSDELDLYMREKNIGRDADPLAWWKVRQGFWLSCEGDKG